MALFDNFAKKAAEAAASAVKQAVGNTTKKVTFSALPTTVEEMKAMPEFTLKDPYVVAGLTLLALNAYPVNPEQCFAMLDVLKGPVPLSNADKSFVKDRFSDKDYVPRSYFEGATPENDYTPAEFKDEKGNDCVAVTVKENPYSRDNEGYLRLMLKSGGADSERPLTLRNKPSTGEWFVFSDSFYGLLAGIRAPKSANPWA